MKKPLIIGMVAALALLLLSSCAGNNGQVTQDATSLPLTLPPTAPAPIATVPTTSVPPASQASPVSTPSLGNQVGNQAPDFQLNDLEGKPVSLSDFRGKPVLLNFWATW